MRTDNRQARKCQPLYSGVLKYFPDALAVLAHVSYIGNAQHNPGTPLHWDRSKSRDEYDACARHLLDRAAGEEFDSDGMRHMAKVAWRALAALQKEIENENQKSQKIAQPDSVRDVHDLMAELRLLDDDDPRVQEIVDEMNTRPGCLEQYVDNLSRERARESSND
jgi:hypothetical protein